MTLFNALRLVITIIICGLFIFAFRKKIYAANIKIKLIILISPLILFIILRYISFDYYLLSFSSPVAAFKYSNSEQIRFLIETNNCAYIASGEEDNVSFNLVNKENDLWRYSRVNQILYKKSLLSKGNGYLVSVVRISSDNCKYDMVCVSVNGISNPDIDISIRDNSNSFFEEYKYKYRIGNYYGRDYYTLIQESINDYFVSVDDVKLQIG